VIVHDGNISRAVQNAPLGATVIVPSGKYGGFTLTNLEGPITLVADVTGELTGFPAADVTIDAAGAPAAIQLSNIRESSAMVIDGFTFHNGTTAGIVVYNSPGTFIQNCTFESNPGDGVLFSGERYIDADTSVLFNNLIINNSGAGVQVMGTNQVAIFSNTFYQNKATGISVGDSANAVLENNIINENQPFGVLVAGDAGYGGDYNLNYTAGNGSPFSPMSIKGPHDLMENPLFIAPTYANFRLAPSSPAIDAGDLNTPLFPEGTTQADCTLDYPPVDLGYHYPTTDPSCPPPTPTPR
jgi:parallel beta-helix repeat protein